MASRLSKKGSFWQTIQESDRSQGIPACGMLGQCNTFSPVLDDISQVQMGAGQSFLYGSALVANSNVILCRIDLLNGVCSDLVNNNFYITNAFGSPAFPFRKNRFAVTLSESGDHPWSDLITNFSEYTQGLGLSINALAGRTIYLVRGTIVVFSFIGACVTPGMTLSRCDQVDVKNTFMYFTTSPAGGSALDPVNNGRPHVPYNGTQQIAVGASGIFMVKRNLPPTMYYQCTQGPFQGGIMNILDRDFDDIGASFQENFFGGPSAPPVATGMGRSCTENGTCGPNIKGAEIYA